MKPFPANPHLIEINAFTFLSRLQRHYGRPLTLMSLPDSEWQGFRDRGFDVIWLMGVWRRSPGARDKALDYLWTEGHAEKILPDAVREDISGSPYAVYDYSLDPRLGQPEDLRRLRKKLNAMNLRLMLDFVPNHLALDHPWTTRYPDRFVQGTAAAVKKHPQWFFETDAGIQLAHGRDPYFPPWTDTVQVNFDSSDLRTALINEMIKIAEVCDGVRCDMAMLGLNSIFHHVWRDFLPGELRIKKEFWQDLIQAVKARFPDFLFMAEVYWDKEKELQALGFDFTYDKRFYDLLRDAPIHDIRNHIEERGWNSNRDVRFIENHDEPRAAAALGVDRSLAAAALIMTLPGMRFLHEGQQEGSHVHVPVQLCRGPVEKRNTRTGAFYDKLLSFASEDVCRFGKCSWLQVEDTEENAEEPSNVLAWIWEHRKRKKIIVVNYGPFPVEVSIRLPGEKRQASRSDDSFVDVMTKKKKHVMIEKLMAGTIRVSLSPWGVLLLNPVPGGKDAATKEKIR